MPLCHTKAVDCVQGGMGQTRYGCDPVTCPHRCDRVLLQLSVITESWHHEISPMAQETLLQCHCVTLKLLTASKEAWDRPDMGVTCPHRCDGVLLQLSVGTEKLAP
jgi:hypothetical protein